MQVIPSVDVQGGRSRLVYWPGAASGKGTPTDRPERIARRFVELGAPLIHLVDLDGARAGRPMNTDVVQEVARTVSTPLQLAGGIDGPEQLELAFAAGAPRIVMPLLAVAEEPARLAACIALAGDWLAVGLDPRAERLREYPWRGGAAPTLADLVARLTEAGVRRFVLSHGGSVPDLASIELASARGAAEVLVAGGVQDLEGVTRLRSAGVHGLILGEVLLTGRLDLRAALAAAA